MSAAPPFRAVVVDDERVARAGLRVLLARDPEVALVAECADGRAAVDAALALRPDLLVLDVQMPGMGGFDVLRALGGRAPPAVIFVTAFEEHAVEAFAVRALDYVLKPFSDERFDLGVGRAKELVRRARIEALANEMLGLLRPPGPPPSDPPAPPVAGPLERLAVRDGGRVSFVPAADIDWIEADDYYAQLHAGARSYLLRESMRELEARLDPRHFVRIHRSAIVRVDRVDSLHSTGPGTYAVRLKSGAELKLSRRRRDHLQALLSGP